jgi:hypothetical protein
LLGRSVLVRRGVGLLLMRRLIRGRRVRTNRRRRLGRWSRGARQWRGRRIEWLCSGSRRLPVLTRPSRHSISSSSKFGGRQGRATYESFAFSKDVVHNVVQSIVRLELEIHLIELKSRAGILTAQITRWARKGFMSLRTTNDEQRRRDVKEKAR